MLPKTLETILFNFWKLKYITIKYNQNDIFTLRKIWIYYKRVQREFTLSNKGNLYLISFWLSTTVWESDQSKITVACGLELWPPAWDHLLKKCVFSTKSISSLLDLRYPVQSVLSEVVLRWCLFPMADNHVSLLWRGVSQFHNLHL